MSTTATVYFRKPLPSNSGQIEDWHLTDTDATPENNSVRTHTHTSPGIKIKKNSKFPDRTGARPGVERITRVFCSGSEVKWKWKMDSFQDDNKFRSNESAFRHGFIINRWKIVFHATLNKLSSAGLRFICFITPGENFITSSQCCRLQKLSVCLHFKSNYRGLRGPPFRGPFSRTEHRSRD